MSLRMPGITHLADRWLVASVLALAPLGLVLIQMATAGRVSWALADVGGDAARQAAYVLIGVVAMLALARIDYRLLQRPAPAIYGAALALLVIALTLGSSQFGARRWIALGPMTVQPSEFAKLAIVIAGAALAAERPACGRTLLTWAAVLGMPGALILLEPDLGTALVIGAAWAAMIVAWGLPWRMLGALTVGAVAIVPIAFAIAVPDYQRERLAVFVHPDRDPLGSGFTLRQVEVALGAGRWFGSGVLRGAHSALSGLATRTSDFAFAQAGEAYGLAGAIAIILLFAVVGWRGIHAASVAPDRFGRLLAVGLTATVTAQAVLHIAVNLRLFPATGIALPFVSAGGSALVAMFAAIGLLESIAARRPATGREQWTGTRRR